MKNSIIALLVIVVFVLGAYAFWEHTKIENAQSPVAQNTNPVIPTGEVKMARVMFGNFGEPSVQVLRKVITENIDGTDQVVSTTPIYSLSVDKYNIVGYGRDNTLWLGDAEGNFKQIIDSVKVDNSAIVSPDHSTVAYVGASKNNSKQSQLLAIDIAIQNPVVLFDHLEQFSIEGFSRVIPFAFSPDGQTIYLHYVGDSTQAYDGLSTNILAFSMKTKQMTKVHVSDKNINQFVISPDHTKIAFSTFENENVFSVYDIASGSAHQFSGRILYGGIGSSPLPWSPDSTKFAFAYSQSPASLMYIDVTDNSTHTVDTPKGASDFGSLYWLDNNSFLSLYENYNTKNPTFWDHGSTLFNIKTGEHTDFVEPPYSTGLIGVIPVF